MSELLTHANNKRIVFDLFLITLTLFFPWWIVVGVLLIGIFIFDAYYEALLCALFLDTFYGIEFGSFLHTYLFTISISAVFLVSFWIKEHLSLSNRM